MKDTGAAGRGSLKGPDNLKKPPLFFTLYPIGRLHGICLFGCACFCIFALAQDAGEHEGAKMIPAGYAKDVGSWKPSLAIRMYVQDTADMKVAGRAVSQ